MRDIPTPHLIMIEKRINIGGVMAFKDHPVILDYSIQRAATTGGELGGSNIG